jgi:hypothetical protein
MRMQVKKRKEKENIHIFPIGDLHSRNVKEYRVGLLSDVFAFAAPALSERAFLCVIEWALERIEAVTFSSATDRLA